MPNAVATPTPEATPGRAADIAAEKAYEASVSAQLDLTPVVEAKPTDTTPKPTEKAAEPAKVEPATPAPAAAPKMSDAERAKWIADYKAEFPDATDEEANEAASEEETLAAKAETDDDEPIDSADFPKAKAADPDTITDALAEEGVTVKLDDIKDPVARKFIEKRLKEMNAGFTRAMQRAQAFRKDEVAYRADQRYQEAHRVDHIVSLILAKPELEGEIAAKLAELEQSPTARKAHDVVVKDAKATARTAEETRSAEDQKWAERGLVIEQYAMRAAEKAGVPYELGIPESILALVHSRTAYDAQGNVLKQGDITRAEVDTIVREKSEKYQRSIRAHKREARKRYIAQKSADAKHAGLKVTPGQGNAPGIGKPATPQTEEEYTAAVLAQL